MDNIQKAIKILESIERDAWFVGDTRTQKKAQEALELLAGEALRRDTQDAKMA